MKTFTPPVFIPPHLDGVQIIPAKYIPAEFHEGLSEAEKERMKAETVYFYNSELANIQRDYQMRLAEMQSDKAYHIQDLYERKAMELRKIDIDIIP